MTLKESFGFTVLTLLLASLVPSLQTSWAAEEPATSDLDRLQGSWEGEGPPGEISITIMGDSLIYYSGTEWYSTTFTLPADTDPQQLHATIKDSSLPPSAIDEMVFAIIKIEDGVLTLAVDDGSDESPRNFFDASSSYHLKRAQPQAKNAGESTPSEGPISTGP